MCWSWLESTLIKWSLCLWLFIHLWRDCCLIVVIVALRLWLIVWFDRCWCMSWIYASELCCCLAWFWVVTLVQVNVWIFTILTVVDFSCLQCWILTIAVFVDCRWRNINVASLWSESITISAIRDFSNSSVRVLTVEWNRINKLNTAQFNQLMIFLNYLYIHIFLLHHRSLTLFQFWMIRLLLHSHNYNCHLRCDD